MSQSLKRERNSGNKLENLGVQDKIVNKIFRNQISTIKKKKLKISRDINPRRNRSNWKDSSMVISKRSINYILQKQANLIGKKKEHYND